MKTSPKINGLYYVIISNYDGSIGIIKGRVCGCYEVNASFTKYKFLIDTPLGRVERFSLDMFESVEELRECLQNYVVE